MWLKFLLAGGMCLTIFTVIINIVMKNMTCIRALMTLVFGISIFVYVSLSTETVFLICALKIHIKSMKR